jgi:glycosyltransferase involved in cell wall biosynthesis
MVTGRGWDWEYTQAYLSVIRKYQLDAILAEFGPAGVHAMDACEIAGIPLITHFHGYDAHARDVVEQHKTTYKIMFQKAAALIVVSRFMAKQLISLGAPEEKIHHIVCSIDTKAFQGGNPAEASPTFVAVGQFVDRKAPHLTIQAFAAVHSQYKESRLRMLGTGPLFNECKALAKELGIEDAVVFLGNQPHSVVEEEMRKARCFVQHSRVAATGDCEGTPVAVLEACATALPVVSTRHAGIMDVIDEGETGFLVDENDVDGMAQAMLRLARDAQLAGTMGRRGRERCESGYTVEQGIGRLAEVINSSIENQRRK